MFFTYFDRYRQMIFFHIFREKYKFACINAYQHNRIDYAYSYMVLSNAGDEIVFDTHCMWCVYACVGEIRCTNTIYMNMQILMVSVLMCTVIWCPWEHSTIWLVYHNMILNIVLNYTVALSHLVKYNTYTIVTSMWTSVVHICII